MRVSHVLSLAATLVGAAACVDVDQNFVRPRVGVARVYEGDLQVTQIGADVNVRPAVLVLGPDSLPMPNLEVRFSSPNVGSVVLGAIQRTDSLGIARVGRWTVRPAPGVDTLRAVIVGVKTLTITSVVAPPCPASGTLAVGDSVSGSLTNGDCLYSANRRAVAYTLTGSLVRNSNVSIVATGYVGRLALERNGIQQGTTTGDTTATTPTGSAFSVFLGSAVYTVVATGTNAADRGAFKIRSTNSSTVVGCPRRLFLTRGAATTQAIGSDGCQYRDNSLNLYFAHEYRIFLQRTERIVVRMSSLAIQPFLLVLDEDAANILYRTNIGSPTSVVLEFVAPYTGYFTIAGLSGGTPNSTGAYTLTIDP